MWPDRLPNRDNDDGTDFGHTQKLMDKYGYSTCSTNPLSFWTSKEHHNYLRVTNKSWTVNSAKPDTNIW